jgi:hypothetical protein
MRRGETDADMRLVAKFIAAATLLQQDPSKMANEITKSRSLEHFVVQVMNQRCCAVAQLVCGSNQGSRLIKRCFQQMYPIE